VTAQYDYEPAENSYAKSWVLDALEVLFENNDELEPALDWLIEISDEAVEALLRQGVVIPEKIRNPHMHYELGK